MAKRSPKKSDAPEQAELVSTGRTPSIEQEEIASPAEVTDRAVVITVPVSEAEPAPLVSEAVVIAQTGQTVGGERREIVKSATLVMLGNLGSSVMGMVRQIVVASVGSAISGPF